MKVLLVVPWDARRGGVVSVAGLLATYLQDRGHQVVLFHPDAKTMLMREQTTMWGFRGFKLGLGVPCASRHSLLNALALCALFPFRFHQIMKLVRQQRIDIVNVHYPMPSYVYFAVCRWVLPIKLVTSVHGADVITKRRSRFKYLKAMRFLLSSSDLIVANSQSLEREFRDLFPALGARTTFIHNGVDLAELERTQHDGPGENQGRYILSIAELGWHKGLDVLIQAFAGLVDVDPSLRLRLAGEGPERDHLEKLARSLGVGDRIEFLGARERAGIVSLLHGCETFVLASRSEPFGIVIIEALACRKAVVATAIGGIPEIIEHGTNGILVEPDNPGALASALRSVLGNPVLRRTLADNGYSTVETRFRYENTGAAYETALRELCA